MGTLTTLGALLHRMDPVKNKLDREQPENAFTKKKNS